MITTAPARRCRTRVRPAFLRHPIRPNYLPASLQAVMLDGILENTFRDALVPEFLFPGAADIEAMPGRLGQRLTMTRTGLLTPTTTALSGDPTAKTYSIEQFSAVLDQYGDSMDTNMLASAASQASLFLRNVQTLGIQAGQSLNQLARNRLYGAYAGGRTWVRTTAASSTTIQVQSTDGLGTVIVNGVPTAVSAGNPLNVTINGVANTVTGIDAVNRTITVGSAVAVTAGWAVVAANAPVSVRPNARASAFNLTTGDTATVGLFFDAVARLRAANVPSLADGLYEAHVDPVTMRQLLSDAEFRQAFQSQGGSETYQAGQITVFGGVRFRLNVECPTVTGDGQTLTVRRPIVLGGGSLIAVPMEGFGQLLAESNLANGTGGASIQLVDAPGGLQVALIVRPPQDRLQQVVSTTWSWVGDFAVPTDSTSGDSALVKRAVVIEHI